MMFSKVTQEWMDEKYIFSWKCYNCPAGKSQVIFQVRSHAKISCEKIHMRSQVRNQLSSHKLSKSIKMKSDHHPLDDSGSIERVREKERETCCRGGHRRRSERSDGRLAASATAADRRSASNSTAYLRSRNDRIDQWRNSGVSRVSAFPEFAFNSSRPLRMSWRFAVVHIGKSSDFNIWKKWKNHKVFFRLAHYLKLFGVNYLNRLMKIKK